MSPLSTLIDSRSGFNPDSQLSRTLSFLAALLAFLLPAVAHSQATFNGEILTIPTLTMGDERYSAELRLQPDSDPVQLDVISLVESSGPPTPDASIFENDTLTIPNITIDGVDYWLTLNAISTNPPILQLNQMALNDADDDDDMRPDIADAFPFDSNETDDTDGDGIGDNADDDDDNDGVPDSSDALPKVADYSAVLSLDSFFSAGTYLEELAIEPIGTDTTNNVELGRFRFNADSSLQIEYPEGNQSGDWAISDNTLTLNLQQGPGLDITVESSLIPEYLTELVVIDPAADVSEFELRQELKRREFQLVESNAGTHTFWVTDYLDISILDDEVNLALFGETDPAPAELVAESSLQLRSQPDLPGESFAADQLTDALWAIPAQFEAAGPNRLVSGPAGPNRESIADEALMLSDALVSFQPDGTGQNESGGQSFNWTIDNDGALNIVLDDSNDEIVVQIVQSLQHGYEVIATASKDGSSYYRKSLAMTQDDVIPLDSVFDEYLVRNFYLFSPDNIGNDNRIKFDERESVYIPFKAFNFSSDNSAIEHTSTISPTIGILNIIRPYLWEIAENNATLLRKDSGSCDVAETDCITERRGWDLLKYENGRLYVLEEVLYPAPGSSPVVYELGQHRDVEYYDVYELSDEERVTLMENVLDFSAR